MPIGRCMGTKMLPVDTPKIAKRIEESGLTREQADAITSSSHDGDTSDLAARGDLNLVRAELKLDIESLRADLTKQIYIGQAATIGILFTILRFVP